jgi:X-X-X-Leu-X-X-Gly heptad repeat protein
MTSAWDLLKTYSLTIIFCMAITGLLWTLGVDSNLYSLAVVSFAIGLSVATAFVFLERYLTGYLSPYIVPLPITLLGLAVGLAIAGSALGNPWLYFREAWDTWILGIFFGIVGFLLMGAHGRLQTLRTALATAEAARLQQEKLQLETHLRLLQAQIEPHFLFNSLSNVISMIHTAPDQAEATLSNLTTLLRASLNRTRQTFTTLGDELEIVRCYLEIQRIRLGARLHYRVDVDPALEKTELPPLLLQPLVENAVRHGIEPLESGGSVTVTVREQGANLVIEVCDNGRGPGDGWGFNGEMVSGASELVSGTTELVSGTTELVSGTTELVSGASTSTGIDNVLGRLDALYHGEATLQFADNAPQGVRATLVLPRQRHAHRPAR